MKTLTVYTEGRAGKAKKGREKLKKIAVAIGASLGIILMLTVMVLLIMKMSVVAI